MRRPPSSAHLNDRTLAALAAGEQDAAASSHLDGCNPCARHVEEFQALLSLLGEAFELPPPPAWFRTRALAAIRRRRERGTAWTGFLRLLNDSLLAPAPSTVRGPASPGRQLLLSGPEMELDLRLTTPEGDTPGRLTGQIHLREREPGEREPVGSTTDLAVEIADELGAIASATPDAFGMFSITGPFQPPLVVTIRSQDWVEEAFVPEASV